MVRSIPKKLASIFGRTSTKSSAVSDIPSIQPVQGNRKEYDPIWKLVALPREQYEALYIETIRNLSNTNNPASLNKAIAFSVRSLKIRRGIILPPGAIPEDIRKQEHLWTYAAFVSALYRSLGIPWNDGKHAPEIAKGWLTESVTAAIESASKGESSALDAIYRKLQNNIRNEHESVSTAIEMSDTANIKSDQDDDLDYTFTSPAPNSTYQAFKELAIKHMDSIALERIQYNNYGSSLSHSGEILFLNTDLCETIGADDFSALECVDKEDHDVGYGDWALNESLVQKGIGVRDLREIVNVKQVTIRKCKHVSQLISELKIHTDGLSEAEILRTTVSSIIGSAQMPPINSLDSVFHQKDNEIYVAFECIKQLGSRFGFECEFGSTMLPSDARETTYSCICTAQGNGNKGAGTRNFHAVAMRGLTGQIALSGKGNSSLKVVVEPSNYKRGSKLDSSLMEYIEHTYSQESSRARTRRDVSIVVGTGETIVASKYILGFAKRILKIDEPSSLAVMNLIADVSLTGTEVVRDLPFTGGEWKNGALLLKQRLPTCHNDLDTKQLN